MGSQISGYEYDIFISYRHKDNVRDGWVTEFVENLRNELEATFKREVSIYFDKNPEDGLQSTHQVSESLKHKLNCAVFIPIVSQTYCDPNCYAWGAEFIPFVKNAISDTYGLNIQAAHGNVYSRVLPIKINELDTQDQALFEQVTGGIMRGIDFIYKLDGVNRPLRPYVDDSDKNVLHTVYRDQLNKVANTLKSILQAMAPQIKVSPPLDNTVSVNIQKELVERRLYKVALVYLLVGLLSWKMAEIGVLYAGLPEGFIKGLIIGMIVLFPLAITMAWFFEKTPSGFALVGSEGSKKNTLPPQKRKPLTSNYWILVLLVLLLSAFLIPQEILGVKSGNGTQFENKSIAVLYFDNMSGDPDQEYFSDGITEEIIARLAKVKGLRVISRTSTRVYKGKARNLKKIAEELNVTVVLEGSFRKEGNQIRVTAQLIDAETDQHIWAETYTRELKEVFKVQSEIAHEIARKFEIDITPEIDLKISEIPTNNIEAYEYFLRGKHIALTQYYWINDTTGAFERAKMMYEKAINLDENFAEPYAGLGDLYDEKRNKSSRNEEVEFTEKEDSLRHALSDKAIKLDPNSSWVNNARAWIFLNRENRDLDSGFYYLKRACELDPNDPHNITSLAGFYRIYAGIEDKALELLNKALLISPMDPNIYRSLANAYFSIGNYEEWNKNKEIENNLRAKDHSKMGYYLYTNNYSKTEHFLDSIEAKGENVNWAKAFILASKGKKEEARAIIKEDSIQWLDLLLLAGMNEEAFKVLKKNPGWVRGEYYSLAKHPNWDPYRKDPDFIHYLDSVKVIYDKNLAKYGPFAETILKRER